MSTLLVHSRGRRGRTESGASATEYGLLVSAIAALVVAVVFLLGGQVAELFGTTCTAVEAEAQTGADCSGG
jgi:pilus assembly protein Flp/PilA